MRIASQQCHDCLRLVVTDSSGLENLDPSRSIQTHCMNEIEVKEVHPTPIFDELLPPTDVPTLLSEDAELLQETAVYLALQFADCLRHSAKGVEDGLLNPGEAVGLSKLKAPWSEAALE